MTDYEVRIAMEEREKRTGIKDPIPPPPLWEVATLLAALVVTGLCIIRYGGCI